MQRRWQTETLYINSCHLANKENSECHQFPISLSEYPIYGPTSKNTNLPNRTGLFVQGLDFLQHFLLWQQDIAEGQEIPMQQRSWPTFCASSQGQSGEPVWQCVLTALVLHDSYVKALHMTSGDQPTKHQQSAQLLNMSHLNFRSIHRKWAMMQLTFQDLS